MKTTRVRPIFMLRARSIVFSGIFAAAVPLARGVYAPIPLIEQGKPLTIYLTGGIYYDSNIFGAESGAIDSVVYSFSPSFAFNASLDKQSFFSAKYRASLDYMPDRPGTRLLDSHELYARFAHTFSPETEIDLSDSYQISKNPESLLPGIGTLLNSDQSFKLNQFDARYSTSLTRRTGMMVKARLTNYAYDNANLANDLDRSEILGGVTLAHTLLPTLKASAEYRYQLVDYNHGGSFKDKRSHFLLGGVDYAMNERFAISASAGVEDRLREGEQDEVGPYAEIGVKADYGKGAFISGGYSYALEETSGVDLFTDIRVNKFFLNWQQPLTPKLVATASLTWEPSTLRGREGISPDRSETNTRIGAAVTYRPVENWSVSATVDLDRVNSAQPGRSLSRQRFGISARYIF